MERVTIAAVGDISTGFELPASAFDHVMQPLRSADLRFAQCERVYSERGYFQQQAGSAHSRQHPRYAEAFKEVPFDILSIASNHSGDWGPEAVEDTAETFRALGIGAVGAGRNITEARKPAIFTKKGMRIAVLAYVSASMPQYWATDTRAGTAPMRAHTFYEPYECQPGAPARVVTVPHKADLEALVQDVRHARELADLVIVSFHWGVHHTSRPCDYQPTVAHAAIDAGAAAIIGHHPHRPQGIEIYKGAAIFYSIGSFSIYHNPTHKEKAWRYCRPNGDFTEREVYTIEPDVGFVFDYHLHHDEGGVVYFDADERGIERVSFLPTLMNHAGQPEVVHPEQPQFGNSLAYLNWAGKFVPGGLTQIKAVGDRYQVFTRSGS